MSGWAARRFWTAATVEAVAGGHAVRLDGRPVRTPGKAPLVLPTAALAKVVATEWDAQADLVRPDTMPVTRAANSAIDKVMPQFDAVADLIADYGGTDLICYRAEAPQALVVRQAAAWDPLMTFSAQQLGAPLVATTGVIPVDQPAASLVRLGAAVRAQDAFALTALHDLVALSGSLVIGLAAICGHAAPEALWVASRIDEDWQAEVWGRDEEAEAAAALKRAAFFEALRFHQLSRSGN